MTISYTTYARSSQHSSFSVLHIQFPVSGLSTLCALCFCIVLCICLLMYVVCFLFICVQMYGQLAPGDNPIAVNKYRIIYEAMPRISLSSRCQPKFNILATLLVFLVSLQKSGWDVTFCYVSVATNHQRQQTHAETLQHIKCASANDTVQLNLPRWLLQSTDDVHDNIFLLTRPHTMRGIIRPCLPTVYARN